MSSSSFSAWLSQFSSLQRCVHNSLFISFSLCSWVSQVGVIIDVLIWKLTMARIFQPLGYVNREWFLTGMCVSSRLGSYLNKAKVEASPKTREKQFDYPLRQMMSREGSLEGAGIDFGGNGSNEHLVLTDGRFSATAGAAYSMCWCHSFKYIHVSSKGLTTHSFELRKVSGDILGCKVVNIQQIRGPSWYIQHSISEYTLKMLSHQLIADQRTGTMCSELA